MTRIASVLVGGYVLLAVATKVAEGLGVRKCGCAQDCWCRRPSLSAFRWVFPWPHRDAHAPDETRHLDHSTAPSRD